MSSTLKQFIGGSFFLIGMFLLLAHSTGASRTIGAVGANTASIFKTLQGR